MPSPPASRLLATCRTLPSWMLVRAPIEIAFTSPRMTAPGQTEASSPIVTRPITVAAGSIQAPRPIRGVHSR